MSNMQNLKQMFQNADKDHSGSLSRREFDQLLVKMGFTNHDMNTAVFNAQDENNDGHISEKGK